MNSYLLIGYPLFLIAFLDALLGFLLLKKNPHNSKVNKSVAVLGFSSALFSLFAGIVYVRASMGLGWDIYYRACWIGWLGIPAVLQSACYLEDEESPKARLIGLILYPLWSIILILCLFTNLVETGAYSLIPFVDRYGPLERPCRLFAGILLLWMIFKFFDLRKKLSGIKKLQLNYFILGNIIFGLGALISAAALQLFGGFGFDPALGSYFSLLWVGLTFYAITIHRLFDIQIIISRTVASTILLIVSGSGQMAIFKFLEPLLGSTWAILISLLVISAALFKTPLMKKVQTSVNGVFLKDKYDYQDLLKESTKAIVTILDQDELLNYLINAIKTSFKINKTCLFLKKDEDSYYLRYDWGIDKRITDKYQIEKNIINWLSDTRQIFIRDEQEGMLAKEKFNKLYGNMGGIEAKLIIPLFFKDQLIGLLTLGDKSNKEPYMQSDVDLLETLASQAAIAIENSRLYTEAITDSLTGLYHHKYFMMRLKQEIERFKRYRHNLSLLMIDIDHFKRINDTLGHPVGDKVLKAVALLIKQTSRKVDIVARYGGEEFAVILPNTDKKGASIMSERIRESIEGMQFENNIKITISGGVGAYYDKDKELPNDELLKRVDDALYRAKQNGRNRIEMVDFDNVK